MIHSDWHIHSEYSYDASLPLEVIAENAKEQGLHFVGITDHMNFNDESFKNDVKRSAEAVKEAQKKYPFIVSGVELTPVPAPELEYIAKHGNRDRYEPPVQSAPYGIGLAATKDELISLGIRYAIGASHWRADIHNGKLYHHDLDACIREWYRQQMYLAVDERVTILGHPWYIGKGLWYEDFSVIPHSMNMDIASALKENGKYVECNLYFFENAKVSEKFRHQYAEFLRELYEMGISVTYGSDMHHNYDDKRSLPEKYLAAAGFSDGDFSELCEKDLW